MSFVRPLEVVVSNSQAATSEFLHGDRGRELFGQIFEQDLVLATSTTSLELKLKMSRDQTTHCTSFASVVQYVVKLRPGR